MRPLPHPFLCIITDETLDSPTTVGVIKKACGAEHPAIQLRMRSLCGSELFLLAERLRAVTRTSGCRFIVHDRIDMALAIAADGVHLPGQGMSSEHARRLIGSERWLGRSVHALDEIEREKTLGAVDYLQFGPVFATPSKAAYGEPQGLDRLRLAVSRAAPVPIVAVGGITSHNVSDVMRAGAQGAAVITAVMRAADPGAATHELTTLLVRTLTSARQPRHGRS